MINKWKAKRTFFKEYFSLSQFAIFCFGIGISAIIIAGAMWTDLFGQATLLMAIFGFIVFIFLSVKSADYDIKHPFIWFNVIFCFYSMSTPILGFLGEYIFYEEFSKQFNYVQIILAQYLAVLAFSVAVTPKVTTYNISLFKDLRRFGYLYNGSFYVLIVCFIISLTYLLAVIESTFSDKAEKFVRHNPLLLMDFTWTIMTVAITTLIVHARFQARDIPLFLIIIFAGYILLALLVSGERGYLFRFFLTLAIAFHIFFKKIKFRYFVGALIIGVYLSTITGAYKMALLRGSELVDATGFWLLNTQNVFSMLVSGEFRSASENLGVALQSVPDLVPFLNGESILMDLRRVFIPGFLLSRGDFPTTVTWFNQTFFSRIYDRGYGVGFSLVGTAYVNFGYPGIIGLFLILGWFTRKLYEKSARSLVILIFYLNFIPLLCYAIRSDLATVVSQGLKHILLPIWVMLILGEYLGGAHSKAPRARPAGHWHQPSGGPI